jgi:hypothetical protein
MKPTAMNPNEAFDSYTTLLKDQLEILKREPRLNREAIAPLEKEIERRETVRNLPPAP